MRQPPFLSIYTNIATFIINTIMVNQTPTIAVIRAELLFLLGRNSAFERIALHEDAQLVEELSAIRKEMSTFRKAHHLDGPNARGMEKSSDKPRISGLSCRDAL